MRFLGCAENKVFQISNFIDIWSFSEFFHKVTSTQNLNIDLNGFFEKNLVLKCLGQKESKWAQSEVFKVILKNDAYGVLVFCINLQQHSLKSDQNNFLDEESRFKLFGPKGT